MRQTLLCILAAFGAEVAYLALGCLLWMAFDNAGDSSMASLVGYIWFFTNGIAAVAAYDATRRYLAARKQEGAA